MMSANFPVPYGFRAHSEVHEYVGKFILAMDTVATVTMLGTEVPTAMLSDLMIAGSEIRANVIDAQNDPAFVWDGSDTLEEQAECMLASIDIVSFAIELLAGEIAQRAANTTDIAWDEQAFEAEFDTFILDLQDEDPED